MTKARTKEPLPLRFIRWFLPKLEVIFPKLAHRIFVTIFFTPFRYKPPFKEKVWVDQAQKIFITVNSKKIVAYSWGEGPVVLVVHGWAGRAAQFRKFIPRLMEAGYKVVGFDGPAHGYSQGRQTNVIEFESVFKEVFLKTGAPVAVIAHSFGGVAALYAIKNGLHITKLINIASPTIGDDIIKTYLKAIHGSPATGEAFKAYMLATYGKSFDEFSALSLVKQVPPTLKLLLIHDEGDEEVSLQHPLELLKVYPGAELQRTTGLGHNRILKDEAVINRCIEFIKKTE